MWEKRINFFVLFLPQTHGPYGKGNGITQEHKSG